MKSSAILIPAAAIAAGAAEELYRYVFCRDPGKLLPPLLDKKKHAPDYYTYRSHGEEKVRSSPARRCVINSARGEELIGHYFLCGDKPSGKIAFIVHGYRSNYAETAGIHFDYYKSRGFDIFACDHTAHGDSGGSFIGYSALESEDCLLWIDYLLREYGRDARIVLHGYSMGGAAVMKMSDRVPDNVRFIVEDSGFDCAAGILRSSLGMMYTPMRLINRVVAGYDLEKDTSVYAALKNARVPMLFVHGRADNMVPFTMAPRLYAACPTEKAALFTDGVVHIETMFRSPEAYSVKLDEYITKYI